MNGGAPKIEMTKARKTGCKASEKTMFRHAIESARVAPKSARHSKPMRHILNGEVGPRRVREVEIVPALEQDHRAVDIHLNENPSNNNDLFLCLRSSCDEHRTP